MRSTAHGRTGSWLRVIVLLVLLQGVVLVADSGGYADTPSGQAIVVKTQVKPGDYAGHVVVKQGPSDEIPGSGEPRPGLGEAAETGYPIGSTVTLAATPAPGYEFVEFYVTKISDQGSSIEDRLTGNPANVVLLYRTESPDIQELSAEYEAIEDPADLVDQEGPPGIREMSVVAYFRAETVPFHLEVSPEPSGYVTLDRPLEPGGPPVESFSRSFSSSIMSGPLTLSAIGREGWRFRGYLIKTSSGPAGGVETKSSLESTTTIDVETETRVIAVFEPDVYTLTIRAHEGGSVTAEPRLVDSPRDRPVVAPEFGMRTMTFPAGTEVLVTAVPNNTRQYPFKNWSGGVAGSENPMLVVMDSDKRVAGHFDRLSPELTLLVDPEGAGEVSREYPHPNLAHCVYLRADPKPGYVFRSWTGDTISSTRFGPWGAFLVFYRGADDRTITAHFVPQELAREHGLSPLDPSRRYSIRELEELVRLGGGLRVPPLGGYVRADLEYTAGPFRIQGDAELSVLPDLNGFAGFRAALDWDWLAVTADVETFLSPFEFDTTRGFVDLGIPRLGFGTGRLWCEIDGAVGWGPQWSPIGGLSHAARISVEAATGGVVRMPWAGLLEIIGLADFSYVLDLIEWDGDLLFDASITASTAFPLPSGAALEIQTQARVELLPWPESSLSFQARRLGTATAMYVELAMERGGLRLEAGVEIRSGSGLGISTIGDR
ncbi:hypothetical protein ACFLS0_05925 [Candidatus Bipolaricaulota bacterium]